MTIPQVEDASLDRRLPPLNALRMFEAAGRLQSIRRAAAELVVTPSAVSRQVRALESWLGVPLFRRDARSVRLTEAGARYLDAVTEHLAAIATATDAVTGRGRSDASLRLRSYTLFATNWLVPRLTRFHRSQPWIELELTTSSVPEDFGRRDVDAEIRPGDGEWLGCDADRVLSDPVVCVCSPGYRAEHRLDDPSDLARLSPEELLRSIASPSLWQRWLGEFDVTVPHPDRGLAFSDSTLTCRAAAAGQGVCLAPLTFVDADLASGRLIAPFPPATDLRLDFYLVYPPDRLRRRSFRAFREWLMAELSKPA